MIIDFKSGKQTERMRLKRDERRDGMDDEERGWIRRREGR